MDQNLRTECFKLLIHSGNTVIGSMLETMLENVEESTEKQQNIKNTRVLQNIVVKQIPFVLFTYLFKIIN